MRESTAKALIKVGYGCNNNCVFCHSAPHRGTELDRRALEMRVRAAQSLGADMIVFSGGEPTIHRDLARIAGLVKQLGLRLGLVTNGRMLSYREQAEHYLASGLAYVYLSLCGPDPALHDRHVRAPGAFDQAQAAIARLAPRLEDLTINVVLTTWNLERLREFPALADGLGVGRLKYSFIEPEGQALDRFDELVPPLSAAAKACRGALDEARSRFASLELAFDGFPLCAMEGLEELDCGLRGDGFTLMSEALDADFFPVDDRNRSFGEVCTGCSLRRKCRGLFTQYLQRRGESELRAVNRPVSNSFNGTTSHRADRFELDNCPIRSHHMAPPNAVRGLIVRRVDEPDEWIRIATRDFSDETIWNAVRLREQLYRYRDTSPLLTDFGKQLQAFRRSDTCRRCPEQVRCGGVWSPREDDGFEKIESVLDGLLSDLRGDLLDVGCGAAPYADAIRTGVAAGRVRYLGLDPHINAEANEPGFSMKRVSFGDFTSTSSAFDAVIALRSLNHLPAPGPDLARMVDLLRPGGRLLLAEDVVFGLLRPDGHRRSVEDRDDLPFEHLYNLDLDEVVRFTEREGMRILEQHEAAKSGCTVWVLFAEKR